MFDLIYESVLLYSGPIHTASSAIYDDNDLIHNHLKMKMGVLV